MACVIADDGSRATLVIGVFTDHGGAVQALDHLHRSSTGCFRLLSQPADGEQGNAGEGGLGDIEPRQFLRRVLTIGSQPSASPPSAGADSRVENASLKIYFQLAHQLEEGANVVVVRAEDPGQQLNASRILLQSSCDVLLTHQCAQRP